MALREVDSLGLRASREDAKARRGERTRQHAQASSSQENRRRQNMRMLSRLMTLAVLSGLLIVPISEARTRIYLRIGPPPIVVERPTLAPRAGYVWQPGYHRWDGRAYVWNAGTWAAPPYRHAR